jgi:uncharacterized protein GlcG (DUF336 family)
MNASFLRFSWCLCILVGASLTASLATPPATKPPDYSATDLNRILQQAADRAMESFPKAVIAIVDRDGRELALRRADGSGGVSPQQRAIAVSKAGTAVFLSSNEQAFSPRTASFIIQENFPPQVRDRPPGPLVGVGFSNLAFSDVNFFREVGGARIPGSRLRASPGGVPLYKNGRLFAGIGVTGDGTEAEFTDDSGYSKTLGPDTDEAIALAGQIGYAPNSAIWGSKVLIDGIRLPYIKSPVLKARVANAAPQIPVAAPPPPLSWPKAKLGGVTGEIRSTIIGDPQPGKISGKRRLSSAEVSAIISAAAARARVSRAGIRLPIGRPVQVFISVVNNPGKPGMAPEVLGTFRTPDAPLFSWDVSVQKARTALFYSSSNRAMSTRAVGFLSQTHFPPGINSRRPGPNERDQLSFSAPLLTGSGGNPELPNGITIFPGGFPLYRDGVLIGAIGVSGDGVDQDDLVAAAGAVGFVPPVRIRADNHSHAGVRLPYAKFPRDPSLRQESRPITAGP